MILAPTNRRVIRPYDKPSFEHTQRYGLIKGHPLGPAGGLKFLALLNEGSGNQVIDLSGNNLTGILAGNMFWAAGIHGTVIENPGGVGTDFIDLGTNSKLDIFGPNQDFSIIAVVNLDNYGLYGGFFSSGSAAANGIVFGHRATTGYPNFSSVNNTVAEITATAIGLHQRKQVAITADRDGNLTFYLAAKVIHQADISGTAAENWNRVDDTYKLFTDRSENNPIDGRASQLYLYNRVLTGAELDFLNREPSCMVRKKAAPVYFFVPAVVVKELAGVVNISCTVTGELITRYILIPPFMHKDLIDPYGDMGAWLWLAEIVVPTQATLRIASNNEAVVYGITSFVASNFDVGRIPLAGDGSVPRIQLRVAQDETGALEDIVNATKGGENGTIKLIRTCEKYFDSPVKALERTYDILTAGSDSQWVTFVLGIPNPLTQRIPLWSYSSKVCPLATPSLFKGPRCQYAGEDAVCTGLLEDCYTKGNAAHWGAEAGLDPAAVRI